jgi:hypothetical protein
MLKQIDTFVDVRNIAAQDSRLAAAVNGSGTRNPNVSAAEAESLVVDERTLLIRSPNPVAFWVTERTISMTHSVVQDAGSEFL